MTNNPDIHWRWEQSEVCAANALQDRLLMLSGNFITWGESLKSQCLLLDKCIVGKGNWTKEDAAIVVEEVEEKLNEIVEELKEVTNMVKQVLDIHLRPTHN